MQTRENEFLARFNQAGVVLDGLHVVYKEWDHGEQYVNKDVVYTDPLLTDDVCRAMAEIAFEFAPQVIVAPAVGAINLGQGVARHLSVIPEYQVQSAFADQLPDGEFVIKRGYENLLAGKRVVVVEDVLTSGGSVRKVVQLVEQLGGIVVAVVAMWNRGGVTAADVGCENLVCLVNHQFPSWSAEECPFCKEGRPITTHVGKGRQYLELTTYEPNPNS